MKQLYLGVGSLCSAVVRRYIALTLHFKRLLNNIMPQPCLGDNRSGRVSGHKPRSATVYEGNRFDCSDKLHQLCDACARHSHCYMEDRNGERHNGEKVNNDDPEEAESPVQDRSQLRA